MPQKAPLAFAAPGLERFQASFLAGDVGEIRGKFVQTSPALPLPDHPDTSGYVIDINRNPT
jgi:hypothetical protein